VSGKEEEEKEGTVDGGGRRRYTTIQPGAGRQTGTARRTVFRNKTSFYGPENPLAVGKRAFRFRCWKIQRTRAAEAMYYEWNFIDIDMRVQIQR
jgi:hypothetical protein